MLIDEDYWTAQAMIKVGGHFVQALGVCVMRADQFNLLLIKKSWPQYWEQYKKLGRKLKKEEKN